ncbi:FAD-dependent 5-carboxymethylaminomethyl-2-thiouridine(34) oxidoreductase MnmC [Brevundimonas sp.]|uniref:FAD-dependent 5-carboxymethylaminomethyl-2-thiouridine(34) oxidoreductase MnmC n=1 Tax=Brevundimonas sp. TaxID=1871086 RepID=UPI003AF8EE97
MTVPPDNSPALIWDDDDTPRSARFGDIYFSPEDGLAETRAVFFAGCGLPDAFAGRAHFCVGELGFGTGLNMAALLMLWRAHADPGAHLSLFSVEGFPLTRDEAARALSAWPELEPAARALLAVWPPATPGLHRLDLPDFNATLDLAVGPVEQGISNWTGRADAWFLDGFSPATNPDMWSPAVMAGIATRSRPGARVATFTVAGAVRRGLSNAGFTVDKRPGHGRKRERLEAVRDGAFAPKPDPGDIIILGAGIAGAALARAFAAQGRTVEVIEAEGPGAGASGFEAALVTPRLDVGDSDLASGFAQALERAGQLYADVDGAVLARGVLQLPGRDRDVDRHARVAEQPIWQDGHIRVWSPAEVSDHVGEPVDAPGLFMGDARVVHPHAVLSAWLPGETLRTTVVRIGRDPDGWTLYDRDGTAIRRAACLILAGGAGTAALRPDLPLQPVRGQVEMVPGGHAPPPVAWGGYAVPMADGLLFGATHDRDDPDTGVRASDTARNQAALASRFPGLGERVRQGAVRSRAATRATTPDRLPYAGQVDEGLYVLGGLGSRGFCLAPLLAEHIAALCLDRPSPLPGPFARKLAPGRRESGLAKPSLPSDVDAR